MCVRKRSTQKRSPIEAGAFVRKFSENTDRVRLFGRGKMVLSPAIAFPKCFYSVERYGQVEGTFGAVSRRFAGILTITAADAKSVQRDF